MSDVSTGSSHDSQIVCSASSAICGCSRYCNRRSRRLCTACWQTLLYCSCRIRAPIARGRKRSNRRSNRRLDNLRPLRAARASFADTVVLVPTAHGSHHWPPAASRSSRNNNGDKRNSPGTSPISRTNFRIAGIAAEKMLVRNRSAGRNACRSDSSTGL